MHSGVNQIFILTQFLTASIHRHIFQTYHLDMLSRGFIDILPAEQTLAGEEWYQGTADAADPGADQSAIGPPPAIPPPPPIPEFDAM